jgi:hypothetical protein
MTRAPIIPVLQAEQDMRWVSRTNSQLAALPLAELPTILQMQMQAFTCIFMGASRQYLNIHMCNALLCTV